MRNYFLKFGIVGISGIVVNEGLLAVFTRLMFWPVGIAGAAAIEISIISNFLLNNYWTWRSSRDQSFLIRILRYHSVAIISGLINYAILLILSHMGMDPLLANLFGIAVGTVINFFLNHYWTFARKAIGPESDDAER
jgi:dolichol-phosphate mannosyltransferase